jgi:transketolase
MNPKELRQQVLDTAMITGAGHISPCLSIVEILITLYYAPILNFRARDPKWDGRDRFILSKGHAALALYLILADLGYYPIEWLLKGWVGGMAEPSCPGVETSTGALGHGLSIGAGMAYTAKLDNKDWKTVVLLGDGECQEGQVWEAAMWASHHRLNNLIAIVDRNGIQALANTEKVTSIEPLMERFSSFGWDVVKVPGHDMAILHHYLSDAYRRVGNNPYMIIADTIKGKGISFMENRPLWHWRLPNKEELAQAKEDLK